MHGALAAVLISVQLASSLHADPDGEPRDGVLVLRNGNTFKGKIWPYGDGYLVGMEGRNEVRLPADQVAYECRDMEEAFDFKSIEVVPGDVNSYVRLARWCLKENLLDHARRQYEIAHGIQPEHPAVQSLSRVFQIAQIARERQSNTAATAAQHPKLSGTPQADVAISPTAVESYRTAIQPLLLNSCALAHCHGERASTTFRIRRNPWRGAITRPFTLKNLEATVRQINADDPGDSPLLEYARLSHGTAGAPKQPQISIKQYDLLKDWVFRAVGAVVTQPRTFQTRAQLSQQNRPDREQAEFGPENLGPLETSLPQPTKPRFPTQGAFAQMGAAVADRHRVPNDPDSPHTTAPSSPREPTPRLRDPFDPAWFNEKYSSQRDTR